MLGFESIRKIKLWSEEYYYRLTFKSQRSCHYRLWHHDHFPLNRRAQQAKHLVNQIFWAYLTLCTWSVYQVECYTSSHHNFDIL